MKTLVITTINLPRPEIISFSKASDWNVVCIGDLKTPKNWQIDNVTYLSPVEQNRLFPTLSKLIPWNMYSRKNTGYLYAIKNKSRIIGETDDDVFPYGNFPPNLEIQTKTKLVSGSKFVNIYNIFGKKKSWPRGFPLEYINSNCTVKVKQAKRVFCPIRNSLIDQDSDFDAIYRFTSNKRVKFKKKGSVALSKGTYAPLNSQNTFFHPQVYLLLYIPSVTPHTEDILRGYIAQRIVWEIGGNVLFLGTTAYTNNRNEHDYMRDFENELPMYLRTRELINILDSLSLTPDIGKSLVKVYKHLKKANFVDDRELSIVQAWVREVEKCL